MSTSHGPSRADEPGADPGVRPNALVTGATSGIGYYTALGLARRGATVIVTGRDRERGENAVKSIAEAAGHARVGFIQADHATVGVNELLGKTIAGYLEKAGHAQRLDVLVNNVGAIFARPTLTADGYEATLAVNFLTPVVLTGSLLPLLTASPSARCITVTSSLGWLARQVNGGLLDDLQGTGGYTGIQAHARAKLLTAAWTMAMARRWADTGMAAATVNPGAAWTALTASLTPEVVPSWRYFYPVVRFFQKRGDAVKAARIPVRLACDLSPAEISGRYFTERGQPGKLPKSIAEAAVQDEIVAIAQRLAAQAATAVTP